MHAISLAPSVFDYAKRVYEGGGKSLGEVTAQARLFEPWNARNEQAARVSKEVK